MLLVNALALAVSAGCYGAVAFVATRARPVHGPPRAYVLWWTALSFGLLAMAAHFALALASTGGPSAAQMPRAESPPVALLLFLAFILSNAVALGGLAAHLVARFAAWPVARAGGAGLALLFGAVFASVLALVATGRLVLDPTRAMTLVAAFFAPHLVGAFALAATGFAPADPARRYVPMALGVMVLFGVLGWLVLALASVAGDGALAVHAQLLGIATPLGVLVAHGTGAARPA